MISAEDRVAIVLGRAIMRAEALAAEVERLKAQLAEWEQTEQQREGERT